MLFLDCFTHKGLTFHLVGRVSIYSKLPFFFLEFERTCAIIRSSNYPLCVIFLTEYSEECNVKSLVTLLLGYPIFAHLRSPNNTSCILCVCS